MPIISGINAIITFPPSNKTAYEGTVVQLACSTDDNVPVDWTFKQQGSSTTVPVYEAGSISDERKFSVNEGNNWYNLTIKNVTVENNGTYSCIDDTGNGESVQATVVVLAGWYLRDMICMRYD